MVTANNAILPYLGTTTTEQVIDTGVVPWGLGSTMGGPPNAFLQRASFSLSAGESVVSIEKLIADMASIVQAGGANFSSASTIGLVAAAMRTPPLGNNEQKNQRALALARARYLTMPGRRLWKDYPAIGGAKGPGTYLFLRPGSDRWPPYLDPQPGEIAYGLKPPGYEANTFTYGKLCYDYASIAGDAGEQGCKAHVDNVNKQTWNWPWLYPLTSPARLANVWALFGFKPLELFVANQYLLPTALHMLTKWSDILEADKALVYARSLFYPSAQDTTDGSIILDGLNNFQAEQPHENPRPPFYAFAQAWRRQQDMKRMRGIVLAGKMYWPLEMQIAAQGNAGDFT